MRVRFCGSIGGSVALRSGETPEQAVERAQETILVLLNKAKRLGYEYSGYGPNVCLELDDTAV